MRPKIRCDGWKMKYFGFVWEVNTRQVADQSLSADQRADDTRQRDLPFPRQHAQAQAVQWTS
jgi:hypothetical protein